MATEAERFVARSTSMSQVGKGTIIIATTETTRKAREASAAPRPLTVDRMAPPFSRPRANAGMGSPLPSPLRGEGPGGFALSFRTALLSSRGAAGSGRARRADPKHGEPISAREGHRSDGPRAQEEVERGRLLPRRQDRPLRGGRRDGGPRRRRGRQPGGGRDR